VLDAEGRIYRVGSVVEDITENRQIIKSHERLIRGFTHDIKNPLGAADGHLALLEMGIHGDVTEQQAESLRRARGAIRAALDLIAQLLKIERAQSGQVEIHRERFDLAALTSYAAEEFRAAAAAKRLDLELLPSRPGDSLVIETDPALVRQILANLISNAVKYTQSGGHISVRAHVASDAETPRRGRWMAVDVADNGPGIPLAKQGMLFHEFARFDAGAAEGTGIGLAISQRLAGVLGASITFTSTPGVGSTFTLRIPDDPLASLAS
jgi:signal transduction histidine kinase